MNAIDAAPRIRPRVGLVLGAGGVRGCAHAGVVRVLHEAGVPIDVVVGASVGSVFAFGLAAGVDPAFAESAVRNSTAVDMFRFYAGRLRMDRNNLIARLVQDAGRNRSFEDLNMPFAAMVTDMETKEVVALRSGPVLPAIEASIALPFVARPVSIQGRYYVDGGVLNTAPVHIARQMGAEIVIAVCLGINFTAPPYIRNLSPARWLVERIGRSGTGGSRFRHQIRFGASLLAATYAPAPAGLDADIAIWPEIGRIRSNFMVGSRICLDGGIRAAEEALPRIFAIINEATHTRRLSSTPAAEATQR